MKSFNNAFTACLSTALLVAATPAHPGGQAALLPATGALAGVMSPADVIRERALSLLAIDPDAMLNFEVEVQLVKDGKLLVEKEAFRPNKPKVAPQQKTQHGYSSISIPLNTGDFVSDGEFDADGLYLHTEGRLAGLTLRQEAADTTGNTALPGCGGFGVGTLINERLLSCITGSLATEFICQVAADGVSAWNVTHQQWSMFQTNCSAVEFEAQASRSALSP
jgi:hypothetical protein